ncbi:MAG: hypothetical protein Q9162_000275 [Coniocarpon cinnabarinum]
MSAISSPKLPGQHTAIVTTGPKAPLAAHTISTAQPGRNEIAVLNRWTASTPLDLHQNDGALLVTHPQVLGDGICGPIIAVGEDIASQPHFDPDGEPRPLQIGDWIFAFGWRSQREKGHQDIVILPSYLAGRLPRNTSPAAAVTLPNNFVTVFHTLSANLQLELPWPKPADFLPRKAGEIILVWGAASSVGMYALQILKWYGYSNVIAVASVRHETMLKDMGAKSVIDYNDPDAIANIGIVASKMRQSSTAPTIPLILDCIGSAANSVAPLAQIAERDSNVAILLPIIIKDSPPDSAELPEYGMDVAAAAKWAPGVTAQGVRTHYYLENPLWKEKLQTEIMPTLLRDGIVRPNRQQIVEGKTMLERAEKAMGLLRGRQLRGERAVWKVSDWDVEEWERRTT